VSSALVRMTAPQVATPVQFLLNVTRNLVGRAPAVAAVADLNHDGRPDLVTANAGSNDVSVLLGHGDGTFCAAAALRRGCPTPGRCGGRSQRRHHTPDLVTADAGFFAVTVLLGRGDGTFKRPLVSLR
jgi:FG-GAP repeat